MACIENLPNEVLEMIFKELPLHDRLICKEVCSPWYKLLMSSKVFYADRHIYLPDNCNIHNREPPMSVFMKAKRPYEILSVKKISENNEYHLTRFSRHLGKNGLKEVNFESEYHNKGFHFVHSLSLMTIIAIELPLIECLSLRCSLLSPFVWELRSEEPQFFFKNLKSVKINANGLSVGPKYLWDTELIPFRKLIPEDVVIEINFEFLRLFDTFIERIPEWVKIKIKVASVNLAHISEEPLLQCLSTFEVERFEFEYPEDSEMDFDFILGKVPDNVKDICVKTYDLPPILENCHKLTELKLESSDIESLKYLEDFLNLKILKLQSDKFERGYFKHAYFQNGDFDRGDECGFGHDAVNLPKLSIIQCENFQCDQCLEAFLKSFENLREICVPEPQRAILNNWKDLKKLYIYLQKFNPADFEPFEDTSELELRHLIIEFSETESHNINLTAENIESIGKLFPKLETMETKTWCVVCDFLEDPNDEEGGRYVEGLHCKELMFEITTKSGKMEISCKKSKC